MTGSLSDIAVRDEARRCGQMRGRRLTLVSRFTVLGSGPSTTQMVADRSPQ
jgi:hypothetical protein